ncbi:MAG: DUF2336 domain-containing protein [Alphaproteobacteria bacterium]|nr:DUF2336 domain-containing protein [Alphaproteobacteria bacterium]
MASQLTQADVAKLLADPSPVARSEIAAKVGLEIDSPQLTAHELELAHGIVRALAKDVTDSVRECLAVSLRRAQRIPHDVAVQLAKDIEQVALPILEDSRVLTDTDLIEIVGAGSDNKQAAIARRADVSEAVADAIVDKGSEKTVATLVGNKGAKIAEKSLGKVVDRFPESEMVQEPLVKRDKLPVAVAERLVTHVSEKLKDYLVTHHEMSPTLAADMILQSRERAIVNLAATAAEMDVEKLVLQLYRNKRLTPSLVIRALCMGDVTFFENAIAVLANVPVVNARILIHDAGRLGMKSLYDKSGLPARLLPAVRVAIDVVHETELDGGAQDMERYRRRVLERILTQFEDMGQEDLDYLLDKLGDIITSPAAA